MLNGKHTLPVGPFDVADFLTFHALEVDWIVADSSASLDQPDKRQFSALWFPASFTPGIPGILDPIKSPPTWAQFKPSASFQLGNFQRIFKTIDEISDQYSVNLALPFEQWSRDEGYLRFGVFDDALDRTFNQDTFSNFADPNGGFIGGWDEPWSENWTSDSIDTPVPGGSPGESHPITESLFDVDYEGDQDISASYAMVDLPLYSRLSVIGGVRFESTDLSIVNFPEQDATWFPPGSPGPQDLELGDADVAFEQDDVLPSIGLVYEPIEEVTLRGSYSETVARQTFKELTPILQQEYVGAPIFIGNPDLGMSALENYDLRVDYTPHAGGLVSASWFDKNIEDPIEYVQRLVNFNFTTPVNYPEGELSGWELEVRQGLTPLWDVLEGLSLGANATFINSEVTIPEDEAAGFEELMVPRSSRDMTNAPEHLYNLYLTYDLTYTGTQFAIFYTVQGDTLVAGAGQSDNNFVPDIYALEFGTLNLSVVQKLGKYLRLQVHGKNLTNPEIQTVYRSDYINDDVLHTSYSSGIELSISLGASFSF